LPLGFLAPTFGGRGVHADDCPPQHGPELAERLPTRVRKHLVLDRRHVGVVQNTRGFRDQPGAREVDRSPGERRQGAGQAPVQRDGEICPNLGAEA